MAQKTTAKKQPASGGLLAIGLNAKSKAAFAAKLEGRALDEALAWSASSSGVRDIQALKPAPTYAKTKPGKFEGLENTRLRWVRSAADKDWFEFIPHATDAFAFVRSDKKTRIQPKRMFTDGGSIPRLFWGWKGFSPWGHGPAFLIHDYQFDAHHCGDDTYSFEQVRDIMMEAVKTLMEAKLAPKDETVFGWIAAAISSGIARKAWDREYPECPLPPHVPENPC
jgi:hypothetical protein